MSVADTSPTMSNANSVKASSLPTGANEWYCKANGLELGPLSFDELIEFVSHGHLDTSNDVKLGANGVWRPMGTVGRLAAVLSGQKSRVISIHPAVANSKPVAAERSKPRPPEAARKVAGEPAKSSPATPLPAQRPALPPTADPVSAASNVIQPAELVMIKAQAAFDAIEQAVTQLIGWTQSPNCSPQWWAVIGGEPSGPDSFSKIFELVVSGRMQPTDFVRNGIYGQFSPVGNLPGVVSAAIILRQARDAFELAKSNAAQLAALTPVVAIKPAALSAVPSETTTPVVPPTSTNKSEVTKPTPIPERPTSPEVIARAAPPMASLSASQSGSFSHSGSGSFSSSIASSSSNTPRTLANRPIPSMPSRGSSASSFFEAFSEKLKVISVYGSIAILTVGLLIAGAKYFPLGGGKSADTQRYNELKQLLAEIRAKREAKSTDFTDIKTKAEKLTKEFTPVLKSQVSAHNPAKQHLLWAVRDDLPKLMKEQLTVETKAEKNFIDRLGFVAMHLKIKHN